MPVVKQYGMPQVETKPVQGGYISDSAPQAAFGVQGLVGAGEALSKAGDAAFSHEERRLTDEADAKALEAYTQYSQKVGQWDQEARAKSGTDTIGVTSKAAKDFGQFAQDIANGLPNEYSRKKFLDLYRRSLTQDLTSLSRFESQQGIEYKKKVREGVVTLEMDKAQKNWGDLEAVRTSVDVVEMMVRQEFAGQPPDLVESKVMAARSRAFRGSVEQALQNDPLLAQRVYDQAKGDLTADDALALEKMLKTPVNEAKARNVVKSLSNTTYGIPVDVANEVQAEAIRQGVPAQVALVTAKIESGGRDDLKNPESSAFGVFQHLDSTWQALGGTAADRKDRKRQIELGVKGLKQTTDELRKGLGREPQPWEIYLGHQQGVAGALALLRGGENSAFESIKGFYKNPETARKAIALNGGNAGTTANQFTSIWKNKFMAALDKANSPMSLDERLAAGKALLGNNPDPALETSVTTNIIQSFNQEKAQRKQREDDAMEEVYRVFNRGGSMLDVPAQTLMNIDEKTRYELAKKIQEKTETNWSWYDQNMGKPPAEFLQISIPEAIANLDKDGRKKFMELRQNYKNGNTEHAKWINDRAQIIQSYAKEIDIDPKKDAERYSALSSYMNRRMDAFRNQTGKEMSEAEFRNEAALAVMNVVTKKGWMFDDKKRVFELTGEKPISIKDMPETLKNDITTYVMKKGKTVSDALLLAIAKKYLEGGPNAAKEIDLMIAGAK